MANDILRCFGGVEHNSLAHLICGNQNEADNGVFDSMYIDDEDVERRYIINENDFVFLSVNCQSLSAKIDSLKILINQISKSTYGSFHVRSTNGLRVTPPISMKVGTRADNA